MNGASQHDVKHLNAALRSERTSERDAKDTCTVFGSM